MDTYDQQIECLLNNDIEGYYKCFTNDNVSYQKSHKWLWSAAYKYKGSLFSLLPGCLYCPSQLEQLVNIEGLSEQKRDNICKLLENKTCNLPNIYTHGESFKFSREELEEFKRRQRLARELC